MHERIRVSLRWWSVRAQWKQLTFALWRRQLEILEILREKSVKKKKNMHLNKPYRKQGARNIYFNGTKQPIITNLSSLSFPLSLQTIVDKHILSHNIAHPCWPELRWTSWSRMNQQEWITKYLYRIKKWNDGHWDDTLTPRAVVVCFWFIFMHLFTYLTKNLKDTVEGVDPHGLDREEK